MRSGRKENIKDIQALVLKAVARQIRSSANQGMWLTSFDFLCKEHIKELESAGLKVTHKPYNSNFPNITESWTVSWKPE